jgi:hypothetical protein
MGRAFSLLFAALAILSGCAPTSDTKTVHGEPGAADADPGSGSVFLENEDLDIREQERLDSLIVDGRVFDEYIVLPNWIDGQALANSEFHPEQRYYFEEYMSGDEMIKTWNEALTVFICPKRAEYQNPLLRFTTLHASRFSAVCLSSAQRSHGDTPNEVFPVTTKVYQCESKPGQRGFNEQDRLVLRHEAMAIKVIVAVENIYVIEAAWHTDEPNPKRPLSADGSIGDSGLYDHITAGVQDAKVCLVMRDEPDTVTRQCLTGDLVATSSFPASRAP